MKKCFNKSNINKILIIFLMVFLAVVPISTSVKAKEVDDIFVQVVENRELPVKIAKEDVSQIIKDMEISGGEGNSAINETGGKIIGIAVTIGMSVSVVMLAVIAMRYFIASANAVDKADVKKQLVPYAIGMGIIFGCSAFARIALSLGEAINEEGKKSASLHEEKVINLELDNIA